MTDDVWRRHANPWSVWTRYVALPMLAAAIWSRVWLGWWALVPVAVALAWIWLNPRAFSPPRSTRNWTSKSVLGERIWLVRATIEVPRRLSTMAHLGNAVAAFGLVLCVYGLWAVSLWPTAIGILLLSAGKTWFLAQMVLVYDQFGTTKATYREWLY